MKKRIIFIVMLLSLSLQSWTQESNRHQISDVPPTSRYEIVQSELGVKTTLKIDKFLGHVYLLVKDSNDRLTWQLMDVEKQSNDTSIPGEVNYQVFTSGLGMRFTFLLNVHSGITWQLAEDSTYGMFWAAFE